MVAGREREIVKYLETAQLHWLPRLHTVRFDSTSVDDYIGGYSMTRIQRIDVGEPLSHKLSLVPALNAWVIRRIDSAECRSTLEI